MKAQLFQVTHTTRYAYRSDVTVAHHLLHLTPRALPRQFRLDHDLTLVPAPTVTSRHADYFANDVTFVTLEGAHRTLEVTARSRVAVGPAFIPEPAETPPWERVRSGCRTDRSAPFLEAAEFSYASPLLPLDTRFADYAGESFVEGRPILEAVLDLTARIHRDFRFDATATTVATPLTQVLEKRRGVCQDFAHLEIACLRSLGLPARYLSGYLETVPPPGQARLIGADASHAWVAFFCPGIGWIDVDPTNNLLPSLQHITLGWGRDYSDVAPIHGIVVGGDEHDLEVAVDVNPQGPIEIEPLDR